MGCFTSKMCHDSDASSVSIELERPRSGAFHSAHLQTPNEKSQLPVQQQEWKDAVVDLFGVLKYSLRILEDLDIARETSPSVTSEAAAESSTAYSDSPVRSDDEASSHDNDISTGNNDEDFEEEDSEHSDRYWMAGAVDACTDNLNTILGMEEAILLRLRNDVAQDDETDFLNADEVATFRNLISICRNLSALLAISSDPACEALKGTDFNAERVIATTTRFLEIWGHSPLDSE